MFETLESCKKPKLVDTNMNTENIGTQYIQKQCNCTALLPPSARGRGVVPANSTGDLQDDRSRGSRVVSFHLIRPVGVASDSPRPGRTHLEAGERPRRPRPWSRNAAHCRHRSERLHGLCVYDSPTRRDRGVDGAREGLVPPQGLTRGDDGLFGDGALLVPRLQGVLKLFY